MSDTIAELCCGAVAAVIVVAVTQYIENIWKGKDDERSDDA